MPKKITRRQRLFIYHLLDELKETLYEWCGYHEYDQIPPESVSNLIKMLKEDIALRKQEELNNGYESKEIGSRI